MVNSTESLHFKETGHAQESPDEDNPYIGMREGIDNDAKACYDQIIPLILLLAYIKAGLPYATAVFFANILYNMHYQLTAAFGTSSYIHCFGFVVAVFGIGQGSTNGPPGCACINNIILKCYHSMCNRCTIKDPGGQLKVKCNADKFVNDNKLMHNSSDFDISLQ
eukprot:14191510-Ditylum_brightwellii.AAC.1